MPADMRDELAAAAKASGKSLSQELLRRLQDSFYRDRDKARDPAMRALCFLIAETAQQTAGLHNSKDRAAFDWRTNPFYFRAFKIAVGKLLDALEPKGKIEPPFEMQFNISEEAGTLESDFLKSFRDPESRGAYAARSIWASLRNIPLNTREDEARRLRERSEAAYLRELYGMPNAARDLQIEIEEDKA
jgi:hypothetical protein